MLWMITAHHQIVFDVLTHWARVMYLVIIKLNHHWFRQWLITWLVLSHYLNQYWNSVSWTLWNKFQWNFYQHTTIFIQGNKSEMSSGKLQPFCFNLNVLWQKPYKNGSSALLITCLWNPLLIVGFLSQGQWWLKCIHLMKSSCKFPCT